LSQHQKRYEKLLALLERVIAEASQGSIVVVEGRHDEDALRTLGVSGKIICVQSMGMSILNLLELLVTSDRVIVLTDFDRKGRNLAKRLFKELSASGVNVNYSVWKEMKALCKSEARGVEDLPDFIQHLEEFVRSEVRASHRQL
jgi:5S rRNA maturation endonuclease (ribonuclease M5)